MNKAFEYEFQEYHINKTWDLLEEKFSFNKKAWKKRFNDYLNKRPANADEIGSFLRFGNQTINPILNEILCRNILYPTFNNLTKFIVTGKNQN
jgi:hypothetical protein